jgi:hypothetical protein
LIFKELHGVICQKIAVFITTSARTTDPAKPTLFIFILLLSLFAVLTFWKYMIPPSSESKREE